MKIRSILALIIAAMLIHTAPVAACTTKHPHIICGRHLKQKQVKKEKDSQEARASANIGATQKTVRHPYFGKGIPGNQDPAQNAVLSTASSNIFCRG